MAKRHDQTGSERCPKCKSNRVFYRNLTGTSYYRDFNLWDRLRLVFGGRPSGRLVEETSGFGLICQGCGHQFIMDQLGTFEPSERSMPLGPYTAAQNSTPTQKVVSPDDDGAGDERKKKAAGGSRRPMPRRAPRV